MSKSEYIETYINDVNDQGGCYQGCPRFSNCFSMEQGDHICHENIGVAYEDSVAEALEEQRQKDLKAVSERADKCLYKPGKDKWCVGMENGLCVWNDGDAPKSWECIYCTAYYIKHGSMIKKEDLKLCTTG